MTDRKCPRCGRGWGYGNCTHHPPCDRKIGRWTEAKAPDYSRLDKMIREAYARFNTREPQSELDFLEERA